MKTFLLSVVLASVALAEPAAARHDTPDVQLQKLLAGRVAGKPTSCLPFGGNISSQIIDGKAIVYRSGSTLYVNQPRSGATDLDDDDILVTRQFESRLCDVDTVRLVDRSTGFPRGFVILDKFVPYTKAKPSS
jgi:hypothetical protein